MTGDNPSVFAQARAVPASEPMVLLYSGMQSQGTGQRSFLATGASKSLSEGGFAAIEQALQSGGRWFGYLGYGLRHELESLPADSPSFIPMPDCWLMKPESFTVIPAQAGIQPDSPASKKSPDGQTAFLDSRLRGNDELYTPPPILSLHSNLSKSDYLHRIEQTLAQIKNGAFYQANITRKFWGEFKSSPDTLALFERLCTLSPAPFSAYLRTPFGDVLSSSPEGFVQMDEQGGITVRPIKGSAPRGATAAEDSAIRARLATSDKDRAENLMIVDLMRNDLSRVCTPGSVEVTNMQEIHSFETIHQMISTIRGQKRPECSGLDAIKACFPPGSMTGAPKVAAMRWCTEQEGIARGIYSGAIGWLDGSGACDLSVVIRTLIIQGNKFEFQVGGGIVADSSPEAEWAETMIKAKGIAAAIGLEMARLEKI